MKHLLLASTLICTSLTAQTVEYMFTKKTTDGSSVSFGLQGVASSNGMFTVSGGNLVMTPTTNFAAASHNQAWSTITSTPTTLAGYGITDAAALIHSHAFADLTSKPTTLSGYGITDALQAGFNVSNIGQSGATNNQVLKWNGTAWAPGTVTAGAVDWVDVENIPANVTTIAGASIGTLGLDLLALADTSTAVSLGALTVKDSHTISGTALPSEGGSDEPYSVTFSIDAVGVPLAQFGAKQIKFPMETGSVLLNTSELDGSKLQNLSVTGAKIASDAIGTSQIQNNAITMAKISATGATSGQVIAYNGTAWAPTNPNIPTRKALTGDVTSTSTSLASVTGLEQSITANVAHEFEVFIEYTTAANTTGLGLSVTTDSGAATTFWADIEIVNGTTGAVRSETINVLDTTVLNTSGPPASTPFYARIRGTITTATSTTLRVRFRSEISGSEVAVKSGSRSFIRAFP